MSTDSHRGNTEQHNVPCRVEKSHVTQKLTFTTKMVLIVKTGVRKLSTTRYLRECLKLVTPDFQDFPDFLKFIEKSWKTKLMRRHDREKFVSSKSEDTKESLPRYILSMFPYPSGRLHLGHVRIYTSGDILTRYSRLLRKNEKHNLDYDYVINPMGFDSFGLPAENAAKERGLNPAEWTNSNIRAMKQQLDDLALQFDWREATSNPSFYKWTQEIFLRLMNAGLVYKSYAQVNWDPIDKTVLADEQVDETGRSWRSGALVEKRNFRQWFIKVNAFAHDIYKADEVDPETWGDILSIQRNWIGKPNGWLFYLPVSKEGSNVSDTLPIFTDKPELFLHGESKLVISDDHWLEKVHQISKLGYINNPFNGNILRVSITNEKGSLPPSCNATLVRDTDDSSFNQLDRDFVLVQAKLHNLGGYYTSDKYRDWLISRQRYWGTPIPVIHCDECGYVGASNNSLPVKLPSISQFNHEQNLKSTTDETDQVTTPLQELAPKDWLETSCPTCGTMARRECETFDTLFDSSWYFLRYATSPTTDKPFDSGKVQPVWCYIGGKEHASMHLFYARFITHFLHSTGSIKFKEPFTKLLVQGVVKGKTYRSGGRFLSESDFEKLEDKGQVVVEYDKMSKSKGNGVDPQELLNDYGIDATRLCLMSYANPRTERLWRSNEEEMKEVINYLRRVTLTVQEYIYIGETLRKNGEKLKMKELTDDELESNKSHLKDIRNKCSIEAIYHIQESHQFRQYIATLHVLLNSLRNSLKTSLVYTREYAESLAALLVMLNPLIPHLTEELWLHFSKCVINPLANVTDSSYKTMLQVSDQPWPLPDDDHPLQIKVRATTSDAYIARISVSKDDFARMSKMDIEKLVEAHFSSNGDTCKVIEVKKFHDLMSIVVANIDSVNQKASEKKRKKKEMTN